MSGILAAANVIAQQTQNVNSGPSATDILSVAIGVGGMILTGLALLGVFIYRIAMRYADRTDGRLDRRSQRQERLEQRLDSKVGGLALSKGNEQAPAGGPLSGLTLGGQ